MKNTQLFFLYFALVLTVSFGISRFRSQSEVVYEQQGAINRLNKKLYQKSQEIESLNRYGGFIEIPVPEDGKSLYLLILHSFNGGAVFPKSDPPDTDLLNTKFYVAYDMENKSFLALRDSSIGFEGKDFVLIISREPDGTRVTKPLKGEEAVALGEKFGLGFGPTRY